MTQYKSVSIKLSDSKFDKLKSAAQNAEKVTQRLSSNKIGNITAEIDFLHKSLLT